MEVALYGAVALGAAGARLVRVMCALWCVDVDGGAFHRAALLGQPVRRDFHGLT